MRLLPKLLSKAIRKGRLTLNAPDGRVHVFGGAEPGPEVTIRITDPSFDWKIALNPELRAAEAYMDGVLTVEDGPEGGTAWDLMEIFFINKRSFDLSPSQIMLKGWQKAFRRLMQHNKLAQSRRNVAHHYDLGNDFYRLWLDGDMQYSCGYHPTGQETLAEAQLQKVSQSLELYRQLKVLGKAPVRLVRYPGEGHGNRRAASRYDYNLRMLRWFEHYLKGPGGPPPPPEIDYPLLRRGEEKADDPEGEGEV